jgi:hypothetical protein
MGVTIPHATPELQAAVTQAARKHGKVQWPMLHVSKMPSLCFEPAQMGLPTYATTSL